MSPLNDRQAFPTAPSGTLRSLPKGVWALGLVSLFMDTSSELVHSLLPAFMAGVLGASMTTIGLVEGIAEAAASVMKVFSGTISDRLGKRKLLALIGYGLAAASKPFFPLATTVQWVFTARFIDRIGKGIRGAPRDALVADIAPKALRGAAYGLRQSLDSVGALAGPAAAVGLMAWFAEDIQAVLWVAVLPAFMAVTVLVFGVREPWRKPGRTGAPMPLEYRNARRLPLRYWRIALLGTVFTLARFSEAFLLLRAQDVGVSLRYVPTVMIVMNLFYAATAYPAGVAADRFPPQRSLVAGMASLIVADIVLAAAASPAAAFIGAVLWGLHMGLTQGLFSKLIADTAPAELRGTAFGIFNLFGGGALLLASVIAGALWNGLGPAATFAAGAVFAAVAMVGVLLHRGGRNKRGKKTASIISSVI